MYSWSLYSASATSGCVRTTIARPPFSCGRRNLAFYRYKVSAVTPFKQLPQSSLDSALPAVFQEFWRSYNSICCHLLTRRLWTEVFMMTEKSVLRYFEQNLDISYSPTLAQLLRYCSKSEKGANGQDTA